MSEKGRLSPPSDESKKTSISSNRATTNLPLTHTVSDPQATSLSTRTPTSTSSFGFKKQGLVTMVTSSGATITSGSATLGKLPKSGARSLAGGLKSSGQEVGSLGHHDDGFLPMSARSTLQYRSLPRPGRSGAAARNGNRSSTSSIESAVLSVTNKNCLGKMNGAGHLLTNQTERQILANQTDREKGVDSTTGGVGITGRQQMSSPTLRR